jgi:hypothetical protein
MNERPGTGHPREANADALRVRASHAAGRYRVPEADEEASRKPPKAVHRRTGAAVEPTGRVAVSAPYWMNGYG